MNDDLKELEGLLFDLLVKNRLLDQKIEVLKNMLIASYPEKEHKLVHIDFLTGLQWGYDAEFEKLRSEYPKNAILELLELSAQGDLRRSLSKLQNEAV